MPFLHPTCQVNQTNIMAKYYPKILKGIGFMKYTYICFYEGKVQAHVSLKIRRAVIPTCDTPLGYDPQPHQIL